MSEKQPIANKGEVTLPNQRSTVTIDQEYFDWLRHGAHILANQLNGVEQNITQTHGLKRPMGFQIDREEVKPIEPTLPISEPQP